MTASPPGAGEENFIPYSQIEPLIEGCASARDLADRLLGRLGLNVSLYTCVTMRGSYGLPTREAIKLGVRVMTNEQADAQKARDVSDEPVR